MPSRLLVWTLQVVAAVGAYFTYPLAADRGWVQATEWRRAAAAAVAAYLVQYFDGSEKSPEGRIWPWFQRLPIWTRMVNSIPHRFVLPADGALKRHGQYIFSMHPHGVISASHLALMTDGSGFLSTIHSGPRRDVVAAVLMMIPVVREVLLWLGNVDAGRATFSGALASGKSVGVYTGGEAEQMESQLGEHTVVVNRRKGFIRLAIKHGVPVVPLYVFGETDLYYSSPFLRGPRKWLVHHFRVALVLFWGRFPWPCWRRGVTMTYAFGTPISPPSQEAISQAEAAAAASVDHTKSRKKMAMALRKAMAPLVDEMHGRYVEGLRATFDRHKVEAGYAGATLKVL